MEEKKKKKKLTLSVSSSKTHNAPRYTQSSGKTSVVIEKKPQRRWGEKKFQPRDNSSNKPKATGNFTSAKPPINRNFDIRKMAEERATKRFKTIKEDVVQQKKGNLGKEKEDIEKKLKDLGVDDSLRNHKGLTPGMLLTLGAKKIKTLNDFAELSTDELVGGYDEKKGVRFKIDGYLEEFALTKNEADELIINARDIVFK